LLNLADANWSVVGQQHLEFTSTSQNVNLRKLNNSKWRVVSTS
jgi:hypothetical protein